MALTKDVMGLTTGYDDTHKGCNGTHNRILWHSLQDMMALTTGYDGTSKGCNGTHNRI